MAWGKIMASFGSKSQGNLDTCDTRWSDILNEVVKYYDCTVLTGHRTKEVQNEKYEEGTSEVQWQLMWHLGQYQKIGVIRNGKNELSFMN